MAFVPRATIKGMTEWIVKNWFDLFSSAAVIGSLLFTAYSLRSETKTRRIANLLAVTANHREIWKEYLQTPKLSRIADPHADVARNPVTPEEELFVGLVIAHINTVFYATDDKLVVEWESLRQDVAAFFSLPLPKAVWTKSKLLQNHDFAAFIDSSLKQPSFSIASPRR